jgi:hypothetical protein
MADEIQTPSAPAPEVSATAANPVATPETDPTPAQQESKSVVSNLTKEIDDLWAKHERRAPVEQPAPQEREAPRAEPEPVSEPEPVMAETPSPAVDQAALEQAAYEKAKADYERQQDATRRAQERLAAEQKYRAESDAYIGTESDYTAVNAALRAASTGDFSALDALDVMLPTGKRVSEVKAGQKGLTQEEAASVLNAWDTGRKFENVMGDRKVQRIVDLWNSSVMSVLADPDVDTAAVTQHPDPANQMKAAIDTTRAAVEKRLAVAHKAELAERDKTIAEQAERIKSLVNERPNLTSQERARQAASPDRPGPGGNAPRDLPRTAEEIRNMSVSDFFKNGVNERLLQSIPGGAARRRRAG